MAEQGKAMQDLVSQALEDDAVFQQMLAQLGGKSRKCRQEAAKVLNAVSLECPSRLMGCREELLVAIERPEAQTRWECLGALTNLLELDSSLYESAIPAVEDALFDEDNGLVRLAALRFLCRFGASGQSQSKEVWPLIDEALQCFHGNPEFLDMMLAVLEFSKGKLDPCVAQGLKARLGFDAEKSRGTLGNRARAIVSNLE